VLNYGLYLQQPDTNPVLSGERWKQYHYACGLDYIPKDSWQTVLQEKSADMIHVLQFPYNGEPPGVSEEASSERLPCNCLPYM